MPRAKRNAPPPETPRPDWRRALAVAGTPSVRSGT